MVTIEINKPIENNYFCQVEGREYALSLDTFKSIFAENEKENDFLLKIHCPGGSVSEGLAIYDFLRTSGKNIYANIEGDCHSMAIILLLSAPADQRYANPNATALIHEVRQTVFSDITEKDADRMAKEIKTYKEKILQIYSDRTGREIEDLRQVMEEEKLRDASFLLEYNFISKVNDYNTNIKKINNTLEIQNTITQMKNLIQKAKEFLASQKAGSQILNYAFLGNDSQELFRTEEDTDHLEVGMIAEPDGVFTLCNDTTEYKAQTTVLIKDGVIAEIMPYTEEAEVIPSEEDKSDEVANDGAESEASELEKENEELKQEIAELKKELEELQEKIKVATNLVSNFVIEERKTLQRLPQNSEMSLKDRIIENRKNTNKK